MAGVNPLRRRCCLLGIGAPRAGCGTLRRRCYQLVLVSSFIKKLFDEASYVNVGEMADCNYWNQLSSQGEDQLLGECSWESRCVGKTVCLSPLLQPLGSLS